MRIGLRSGVVVVGLFGLLTAAATGSASAQAQKPPESATSAVPLPGANSFAEPQARKLIEAKGFSDVSPLMNDSQGVWRGTAKSGSNRVRVTVDYKGNVSANPE
jgi:hypothetical protein